MFETVGTKRLHEEVATQIAKGIVSGTLSTGDPLPSESLLSDEFGVSRAVVREALRSLNQRGLIRTNQGKRTVVEPPSSWNLLDSLVLEVHRDLGKIRPLIRDFLWIRRQIEPGTAAQAAIAAGDEVVDDLRRILAEMHDCIGDQEEFFRRDIAFHIRIAEATGNQILIRLMMILGTLFNVSREPEADGLEYGSGAISWHSKILAAIEGSDQEAAMEHMRAHLEWTEKRLLGAHPDERAPA